MASTTQANAEGEQTSGDEWGEDEGRPETHFWLEDTAVSFSKVEWQPIAEWAAHYGSERDSNETRKSH